MQRTCLGRLARLTRAAAVAIALVPGALRSHRSHSVRMPPPVIAASRGAVRSGRLRGRSSRPRAATRERRSTAPLPLHLAQGCAQTPTPTLAAGGATFYGLTRILHRERALQAPCSGLLGLGPELLERAADAGAGEGELEKPSGGDGREAKEADADGELSGLGEVVADNCAETEEERGVRGGTRGIGTGAAWRSTVEVEKDATTTPR